MLTACGWRSALAAVATVATVSSAQAVPFDGTSAATAGYSAAQILADGHSTGNGLYWIDPYGAGGNAAFQVYADMTTNGGGWMLVRHIAGTGGWINTSDNLAGTASIAGAANPLATASWTIPYATLGMNYDDFLFMTGDKTAWGELAKADVFATNNDLNALNAQVIASSGTGVAAGGYTNVLNRSPFVEDPWIGFQGTHSQNTAEMFYGEGNFPPSGSTKRSRTRTRAATCTSGRTTRSAPRPKPPRRSSSPHPGPCSPSASPRSASYAAGVSDPGSQRRAAAQYARRNPVGKIYSFRSEPRKGVGFFYTAAKS